MMDPQFAYAVPDRLRIARVTKGQTIQTRCDQGSRPLVFQSHPPLPEDLCLFDLNSHDTIVVYELHYVKAVRTPKTRTQDPNDETMSRSARRQVAGHPQRQLPRTFWSICVAGGTVSGSFLADTGRTIHDSPSGGCRPISDIRASDFEARKPTFVPLLQGLRIQPFTAALRHLSYASLVAGFLVLIPPRMP